MALEFSNRAASAHLVICGKHVTQIPDVSPSSRFQKLRAFNQITLAYFRLKLTICIMQREKFLQQREIKPL